MSGDGRTVTVGVSRTGGLVGLTFEVPGQTRMTVTLPWREAARLMAGLGAAVTLLALQEGLSDAEIDTLMTAYCDQSVAEMRACLGGDR